MQLDNKKILIFSTAYLPLVGGAELAVQNITDQLVDFDFDLITARLKAELPSQEKVGRVNIYRIGFGNNFDKLLLPFLGLCKALFLNHRNNYRVIWSVMASYGGLGALFFKCTYPSKRLLLTLQEGDDFAYIKKRSGIFYFLIKQIFVKSDYVQAISNYLADWGKSMGAKCPIQVVPNGVDLNTFKANWRVINLDKKIIITVSRLVEKNGLSDLIKAMSDIEGQLWIVGSGPLQSKLEQLAKELGVVDRIKFLGEKSPEEVNDLLTQASLFIRPSLSEGLGNAFLEAMAVGVPTIGTAVGGIPDFLTDNVTGWLCESNNPNSIAEKINYILIDKNASEVVQVATFGQSLARESYNWKIITQKFENIFERLGKPKILIATGIYPPDIGGPATMIGHLAGDLRAVFEVSVLTYSQKKKAEVVARVAYVPKGKKLSRLHYLWRMYRLSRKVDLIYVTDIYSVGYFAYLIQKLTGKKYIVRFAGDSAWETATANGWTNDYIIDFEKNIHDKKIEAMKDRRRKILVGAERVIAVSQFMSELALLIGVKNENLKVIYNSVDFMGTPIYSVVPDDRLPRDGRIIMTSCRLTKWKGVDLLIKTIKEIQDKAKTYLVVIGDGPEMNNLKQLAKDEGVFGLVIFLGSIPHEMVLYYYRKADVFVLNTNYEGLSHTLLEVMKAGVPIVATKVGGNPEVVEDGVSGLLVDYGNSDELMEAIVKILKDKDLAKRLSEKAINNSDKFVWQKTVSETVALIKSIL